MLLSQIGAAKAHEPLFEVFAGCTGRYSAQMEHAWLMNDPAADDLEAQRLTFVSLLEAVTPQDKRRDAMAKRIESKLAHSSLLTTAAFASNSERAQWAKRQSTHHLNVCQRMLLDS